MKKFKFLAIVFLILSLSLALFACGDEEVGCKHSDTDKDGVCDECKEKITLTANDVKLLDSSGKPRFQFVLENEMDEDTKALILELQASLEAAGITVDIAEDKAETKKDCEIIFGNVTSRGGIYSYNGRELGSRGYIIKIVDEKIIISAGSTDSYSKAIGILVDEIFAFDGEAIKNTTMKVDQEVEVIRNDYSIKSLKLLGEDMKGYTIAADKNNEIHLAVAKNVQDIIYSHTGYWLDIVDASEANKSIVIKKIDKVYGEDSFKVLTSGTQLLIECAFDRELSDAVAAFLTTTFVLGEGNVNLEGELMKKDVSFLTYEQFGATNNGKKDNDFEAIYNAHKCANESGQRVIISGSPTYYISYNRIEDKATYIEIKTATNWGNAKFIVDDSVLDLHGNVNMTADEIRKMSNVSVIRVLPDRANESYKGDLSGIEFKPGVTKLDLGIGVPVLIQTAYTGHKVYRRKGYSSYSGSTMAEVILLDKDGNIDPTTPIMWTYPGKPTLTVHYVDEEPLLIEGGTFTTIACDEHMMSDDGVLRDYYYARNLMVQRSNTTVLGTKHYVEGEITLKEQVEEGKLGIAYSGFFYGSYASGVIFENCVLSGRRCYTKTDAVGGGGTTGTYDFGAGYVNKIVLDGCIQHNFWIIENNDGTVTSADADTPDSIVSMARSKKFGSVLMHWGLGGTNWCKNMEYINSVISRYDAHCGLYNGKVIGSTVNILALTGMGEMIVEDTTFYSLDKSSTYNTILHLRSDYGSTWDGEIKIKNLNAYLYNDAGGNPYVVMSTYTNWYYGYKCAFPSIEMDNVVYYDANAFYKTKSIVPFDEGDVVLLYTGNHIKDEPNIHLENTVITPPVYSYDDFDKNGYVDGYDSNGDGIPGGKGDMPYNSADRNTYRGGIKDENSRENLNPITPPVYIKVFNNNGADTDGDGVGDSGGVRISVDRTDSSLNGGFFGNTKFYYAPDKYYTGTGMEKAEDDNAFKFN